MGELTEINDEDEDLVVYGDPLRVKGSALNERSSFRLCRGVARSPVRPDLSTLFRRLEAQYR